MLHTESFISFMSRHFKGNFVKKADLQWTLVDYYE